MALRRTGYLCTIALVTLLPCSSQPSTRHVSGVVTDKRGNALNGAVVLLENTQDLSIRSFITQKDGHYRFEGLNSDVDFTLKAHYKTWWSHTHTLSKFNESKDPEITLVIPID